MRADTWKEFEHNPISHSVAHHLMAIAALRETQGYARASDVAKRLNISRSAESLMLRTLKERGLVTEDENRFVNLTPTGRAFAESVQAKKMVLERFLVRVLGISEETAAVDTCKIEHLVSHESARKFAAFLAFIESHDSSAQAFKQSWAINREKCTGDPLACSSCEHRCVMALLDG